MSIPRFVALALLCTTSACTDPGGDDTGTGTNTTSGSSTGSTGASTPTTSVTGTGDTGDTGDTGATNNTSNPGDTGDTGWTPASCFAGWDELQATYPDAGTLVDCAEVPGGYAVVRALLVVDGITIDNNGAPMQPCVEARCDQQYAYIGSNDLPHYDFVQTTPNALAEAPAIYRIPLAPVRPGADVTADPTTIQSGCEDAYAQHLDAPQQATAREPSGLCLAAQTDAGYLRELLASGETATYAKIRCLGNTAVAVSGVAIAGPNEAQTPDPYGNPLFAMPDLAGQPDATVGAALDLCGGHTGGSFHNHGLNAACFEQAPDGTPANSYAVASQAWDLQEMLTGPCSEPSGVLGWSLDGYPIKGPCVCTAREGETCTAVKRVRASWVYEGLASWGEAPGEDALLGVDGMKCDADDSCCPGGLQGCNFSCSPVVVAADGADGSAVEHRCALLDYSWCTHRFVDNSTHGGDAAFVYLDRCNGFEGADGYAYHATASFPYVNACYRGVPTALPMMIGGGDEGGMEGGMDPPKCQPGQMMCCGDDFCGGPETAMNCPEDCG